MGFSIYGMGQSQYGKSKPKENRLKLAPLASVNYSQEDGWGFFAGTMGSYRVGFDTTAPLSSVALVGYASTKGAFKGALVGAHHSKKGDSRLEYKFNGSQSHRLFWGVGYANAVDNSNYSTYIENGVELNLAYRFYLNENLDIAPSIGFDLFKSKDFSDDSLISSYSKRAGGLYLGLNIKYDTKDDIFNPTKGTVLELSQRFYPIVLYGSKTFYQTIFIWDFFIPLWESGVLGFDSYFESNYGDSPWFVWTPLGGDTRMRGYYYGRYRDKNSLIVQVELRQKIYKYHSAVLWGGGGNIFPSFSDFDIKNTLPNYGVGYRFTIGPLVLKADLGFGKGGEYGLIFGFSHSF